LLGYQKYGYGGEDTLLCLWRGDPQGETRSAVTAAQDKALETRNHATKILQLEKEIANVD
jgi:hypothetical protein